MWYVLNRSVGGPVVKQKLGLNEDASLVPIGIKRIPNLVTMVICFTVVQEVLLLHPVRHKVKLCIFNINSIFLDKIKYDLESGQCSWYGAEGEIPPGYVLPSGEIFDRFAMRAAHKTLPFGTRIRVTNNKNGRSVDVIINDRGPFVQGRIVDLTFGAFGHIDNHDVGVVPCSYVTI